MLLITTYMTYFYTDLFKKYFKLKLHKNVCLYERKRCKIYPTLVKANKIIFVINFNFGSVRNEISRKLKAVLQG